MIDLDRFKEVNDAFGHAVGDSLLIETANRLKGLLEEGDTLARMSGAELALMVPIVAKGADCFAVAKNIVESLRSPVRVEGYELVGGLSVGISLYPEHGQDPVTFRSIPMRPCAGRTEGRKPIRNIRSNSQRSRG